MFSSACWILILIQPKHRWLCETGWPGSRVDPLCGLTIHIIKAQPAYLTHLTARSTCQNNQPLNMLGDINKSITEMRKFLKIPKKRFLFDNTSARALFIQKLLIAKIKLQIKSFVTEVSIMYYHTYY